MDCSPEFKWIEIFVVLPNTFKKGPQIFFELIAKRLHNKYNLFKKKNATTKFENQQLFADFLKARFPYYFVQTL